MIITFVKKEILKHEILSSVETISMLCNFVKYYKEYEEFVVFIDFLKSLKDDSTTSHTNALSKLTKSIQSHSKKFENSDLLINMFFPFLYALMKNPDHETSKRASEIVLELSLNLQWTYLHSIIVHFLNELSVNGKKNSKRFRALALTLMCGIIESFSNTDVHKGKYHEIKKCLTKEIVPNLYNHLWKKQKDIMVMRMDVTLLIVKILKQYDEKELELQLSRIITGK
jgi:hypothetical protein